MQTLSENGFQLLALLVDLLPRVVPGKPESYITYKDAHARLSLPGTAQDLERQGLADLADYLADHELPSITGLVIRSDTYLPGKGYFKLYGRQDDDFQWWQQQIEICKAFDWHTNFNLGQNSDKPLIASDIKVPDRIKSETLRIIRDTAMARKVKRLRSYSCQICGDSIQLPDGTRYVEAHHLKPLGTPHNGPDVQENIICVCPNHHVELDYFGRRLDPKELEDVPGHTIDPTYIAYHNEQFDQY